MNETSLSKWSPGGQIFFCNSKAWGIAPNLQSICLGNEADILEALKEKTSMGNNTIDNILQTERNNW